MRLISHRGNTHGTENNENSPELIAKVLNEGYDVEIDVRKVKDVFYLGHDTAQYKTTLKFIDQPGIWIHAKDQATFSQLIDDVVEADVFYHTHEDVVLTKNNYLWTEPGKELFPNSVQVNLGHKYTEPHVYAVCSDYISEWRR